MVMPGKQDFGIVDNCFFQIRLIFPIKPLPAMMHHRNTKINIIRLFQVLHFLLWKIMKFLIIWFKCREQRSVNQVKLYAIIAIGTKTPINDLVVRNSTISVRIGIKILKQFDFISNNRLDAIIIIVLLYISSVS